MGIEYMHYVIISNSYATMVAVWVEFTTASIILTPSISLPESKNSLPQKSGFPL